MTAVRPALFSEFTGQQQALSILKVAVRSAKARKATLGHVLITGPKGLGKTTLAAHVLPAELGVKATQLICSDQMDAVVLSSVIGQMRSNDILFLDELHAMPVSVQESLYSVLEDSALMITLGTGKDAKPMMVPVPPFTIIGATTRLGRLSDPLQSRFKHVLSLQVYSDEEMVQVLAWTAQKYEYALHAPEQLVPACHGTARQAGRLIEACVDTLYSGEFAPEDGITAEVARETLKRLGYAPNGLTAPEVKLLQRLAESTGPLGLNTLSTYLDEDAGTVETVHEPWLIQQSFMVRTPSGRQITAAGREALHVARSR